MSRVNYELVSKYGVISTSKSGWSKELNLVSWNEREAKYDIREWSPEYDKMSKGLTLTQEELKELREILNNMEL